MRVLISVLIKMNQASDKPKKEHELFESSEKNSTMLFYR